MSYIAKLHNRYVAAILIHEHKMKVNDVGVLILFSPKEAQVLFISKSYIISQDPKIEMLCIIYHNNTMVPPTPYCHGIYRVEAVGLQKKPIVLEKLHSL